MNHIIFGVYQTSVPGEVNEHNHNAVVKELKKQNIPLIEVEGCWLGTKEKNILLSTKHEAVADTYSRLYKQQCYLKVDSNNNAELVITEPSKLSNNNVNVGMWQQVSRAVAENSPSYTKHGENYYLCSEKLFPSKTLGSRC